MKVKKITKSFFMGIFSTGGDFIVFSLLNYVLLLNLRDVPFKFGPFDYGTDIGGLCTFLAMVFSYITGSIISYYVQRKFVFKSHTNLKKSAIEFAISTTIIYFFVVYFTGLIAPFFAGFLGDDIGPFVAKCISQFIGFIMQYYLNKYIILPEEKEEA